MEEDWAGSGQGPWGGEERLAREIFRRLDGKKVTVTEGYGEKGRKVQDEAWGSGW